MFDDDVQQSGELHDWRIGLRLVVQKDIQRIDRPNRLRLETTAQSHDDAARCGLENRFIIFRFCWYYWKIFTKQTNFTSFNQNLLIFDAKITFWSIISFSYLNELPGIDLSPSLLADGCRFDAAGWESVMVLRHVAGGNLQIAKH